MAAMTVSAIVTVIHRDTNQLEPKRGHMQETLTQEPRLAGLRFAFARAGGTRRLGAGRRSGRRLGAGRRGARRLGAWLARASRQLDGRPRGLRRGLDWLGWLSDRARLLCLRGLHADLRSDKRLRQRQVVRLVHEVRRVV